MNDQQMSTLLEMQRSLGRIESTVISIDKTLEDHIVTDASAYARISTLEAKSFKQAGASKVWHLVGVGVGSLLGFIATYFGSHR